MKKLLILPILLAGSPTAYAATYTLTPLTVNGAGRVNATGVNDFGVYTGSYFSQAYPYGAGFYGKPGQTVTLPTAGGDGNSPQYYNPVPTGINNAGSIIGTYNAGETYVFVWQGGRYIGPISQGYPDPGLVSVPFITNKGRLCFTENQGDGQIMSFAGTPAMQTSLHGAGFPVVASTNASLQVAGTYDADVGNNTVAAVFMGSVNQVQPLLPPNAQSSSGGWINDHGQVAGAYTTKDAQRGFVYAAGAYHTFSLPTKPTSITVQGIDQHGHVVGVYNDAVSQYGLVYAHGKATQVGSFASADLVHVAISGSGKYLVISDSTSDGAASQSYVVTCSGSGCP